LRADDPLLDFDEPERVAFERDPDDLFFWGVAFFREEEDRSTLVLLVFPLCAYAVSGVSVIAIRPIIIERTKFRAIRVDCDSDLRLSLRCFMANGVIVQFLRFSRFNISKRTLPNHQTNACQTATTAFGSKKRRVYRQKTLKNASKRRLTVQNRVHPDQNE